MLAQCTDRLDTYGLSLSYISIHRDLVQGIRKRASERNVRRIARGVEYAPHLLEWTCFVEVSSISIY